MSSLEIKLLGGFEVRLESGRELPIPGRKAKALLAYLALTRGEPCRREALVGLLWSERGEAQARASLRQTLSDLRKVLGEAEPAPLVIERDSVALASQAVRIDLCRFEALVDEATVASLAQAAALYRGEFLAGFSLSDPAFEDWQRDQRVRLHNIARDALARLLDLQTAAGETTAAMATAKRLLGLDPLHEAGHRALMHLYAETGDRAMALRQYELCRDALRSELGLEPEAETQDLRAAISVASGQLETTAEAPFPRRPLPAVSSSRSVASLALRAALAASLAALLVIIGLSLWRPSWLPGPNGAPSETAVLQPSSTPSIAVLPFRNLSDDPKQDYFADGLAEDLITDLSKISGLTVIGRNAVFTYKGRAAAARQVAEELGVRYIVEGSLRRSGERLRVNTQLLDSASGRHLWAGRYDGTMADVFELQDRITEEIIAALEVTLTPEEEALRRRPETRVASAYDAFLEGWSLYRRFTPGDLADARPHFERAIALDPDYGRAHAALAAVYFAGWRYGPGWHAKLDLDDDEHVSWTRARVKAEEHLAQALRRPTPLAHRLASAMEGDYRQFEASLAEARRAIELDPGDPEGHVALTWALIYSGQAEAAVAAAQEAIRLDPQHPATYLNALGVAQFLSGRYDEAVAQLERAYERNANLKGIQATLAAAYAYVGKTDAAREALAVYTNAWPHFTPKVDRVMEWRPFAREDDIRHYADGLILAGLCCEERLEAYIDRVRRGGTLR